MKKYYYHTTEQDRTSRIGRPMQHYGSVWPNPDQYVVKLGTLYNDMPGSQEKIRSLVLMELDDAATSNGAQPSEFMDTE